MFFSCQIHKELSRCTSSSFPLSPCVKCSHHSLKAYLTSRVEMKAWAFEYPQDPLMPNHEVCLRAFSIPDSGNQSERFLFVSESRRSSRWTVSLNWMYAVRLLNRNALSQVLHSRSAPNLTMQLARYLLCNCKTVVERYGWNRCRTACLW